jgi:hypothetical protein
MFKTIVEKLKEIIAKFKQYWTKTLKELKRTYTAINLAVRCFNNLRPIMQMYHAGILVLFVLGLLFFIPVSEETNLVLYVVACLGVYLPVSYSGKGNLIDLWVVIVYFSVLENLFERLIESNAVTHLISFSFYGIWAVLVVAKADRKWLREQEEMIESEERKTETKETEE